MVGGLPHGLARQRGKAEGRAEQGQSRAQKWVPSSHEHGWSQAPLPGWHWQGVEGRVCDQGQRWERPQGWEFPHWGWKPGRKQVGSQEGSRGGALGVWGGVRSSALAGEASPTCGRGLESWVQISSLCRGRKPAPTVASLFSGQVELRRLGGSWEAVPVAETEKGAPQGG